MNRFWNIDKKDEVATLQLYGVIGDDGDWYDEGLTTPRAFADELAALKGKPLDVRINSSGGSVFAAHCIYNQLKNYASKVTVTIEGLCASAATIVACAGYVRMPRNALIMIHEPTVEMSGLYDGTELKRASESIAAVRETIFAVYRGKCGDKVTPSQLSKMLRDETWLDADEAKKCGFVDEIIDQEGKKVMATMQHETLLFSLMKRADDQLESVKRELMETKQRLDAVTVENEELQREKQKLECRVAEARAKAKTIDELYQMIRDQLRSGAEGVKASVMPMKSEERKAASIAEVVKFANQSARVDRQ